MKSLLISVAMVAAPAAAQQIPTDVDLKAAFCMGDLEAGLSPVPNDVTDPK